MKNIFIKNEDFKAINSLDNFFTSNEEELEFIGFESEDDCEYLSNEMELIDDGEYIFKRFK